MERHARGLTLLEMLVALLGMAALATIAVPLCRELLLEGRMVAAVNGFVHAIHLARVTAASEARDVVVCRSLDAQRCAPAGDWTSGWLVFVNRDGDDPAAVDPDEPVLAVEQPLPLASVRSNRRAFALHPFALRASNGTVVFCDARGPAQARAVIVSYSGRPRLSRVAADGRPLTCPT